MSESSTIRWDLGEDGILVLTLDDPDNSANIANAAHMSSMEVTVKRLQDERDAIRGVIITSAKQSFFAGADLTWLRQVDRDQVAEAAEFVDSAKRRLRCIETLGRPVVAAINGAALGGGLELALAAHHRIIVDDPRAVVGFPEVTLGVLPGAGGIVRTVRMFGIVPALTGCLLKGQRLKPADARQLGLVDEIVPTIADLLPAARAWIHANPDASQPWDHDGYRIPNGTPADPAFAANLPALSGNLRKQLRGANFTAPPLILAAAVEGALLDFDSAMEVETRYFVELMTGQIGKNMMQAFFFDMQRVSGDRDRPTEQAGYRASKVVILGAGMMGAGIAYVCAKAGIEVVLKDQTLEAAQRGKDYSANLVEKAVTRGISTQAEAEALLRRIVPTDDPATAQGADLMIEAVFEDPDLKASVYRELEPFVAKNCLLSSNASTLPISDLAHGVSRPADFIGLHFFSPVDRMPLLEIIRGTATEDSATYRALDFARQIKKTPIVVNDSRGFFTSRVIGTFINEGIAMLAEGIPAPSIEQAASQAGYPAPVLQLSDELNIELMARIRDAGRDAALAAGDTPQAHPAFDVFDRMLDAGRPGRIRNAGFYDYADGKRQSLWPGLKQLFPPVEDPASIRLQDLIDRMLFIEALEAVKCFDERVIESVADANVGSILGIGYPAWTGGVLQFVDGRPGGVRGFVDRCEELAAAYGERFLPPQSLLDRAQLGLRFSDETLVS